MGEYYCNSCDKTIKLIHKKRHLITKSNMYLSESIINKYSVKNPVLNEIEKILQKNVNNYIKRLEFYHIICNWKLQFVDTINDVKSKRIYSNGLHCGLIKDLIRKNNFFRRQGLRFSHILELTITFISSLNFMTVNIIIINLWRW